MRLVLNAGSTSLKFALFDSSDAPVLRGQAEEIGRPGARFETDGGTGDAPSSHAEAVKLILAALHEADHSVATLTAAVHRVVHGGEVFDAPALLDEGAFSTLESVSALAPLHNPPALMAARALHDVAPDLRQVAVFDTAFHAMMPAAETVIPLPREERARGLRRYGFHGISYAGVVQALDPLPRRLLALHLGGGCSACAILDGRSVATTMGYSPVSGLPMGSRAGDIDAMAVLDLARRHGVDGAERILNHNSGLTALGGSGDMRTLRAEGRKDTIAHFLHWTLRHCVALISVMRGLDAVAFTGGIGENDAAFRSAVMEGLAWTGCAAAHVVPAREEETMLSLAAPLLV